MNIQTKIIFYKGDNNALYIGYPTGDSNIDKVISYLQNNNLEYTVVNKADVDVNIFEFQEAFEFINKQPVFVSEKMKEIMRNRFRVVRKPILEKLDIEYMKALEANNTQKQEEIKLKKELLRDITLIEFPDDLEGIKNTWPGILND